MELKHKMRQEKERKKALCLDSTDGTRKEPTFEEIDAGIGQLTKNIQELLEAAQSQKTQRLSLSCDKVTHSVDCLTELFLPVSPQTDGQIHTSPLHTHTHTH